MKSTGILLLVTGLLLGDSMYELFGAKDTIGSDHPGNTDVFQDDNFQRRDLVYFSGPRGSVTVNITSNIIQTKTCDLGMMEFHAEIHNSKNDTLVLGASSVYHVDGRVIKFLNKDDRAQANLFIPYLWDFPIYITTYITKLEL